MGQGARELGLVLGSAALLVTVAGCASSTARSEECLPGDFEAVAREDGGSGLLRCTADGGSYVPYGGPDPNAPADAGVTDTMGVDAALRCSTVSGSKLGFMCTGCSATTDCAAGLDCVDFVNKGGFTCSPKCTSATAPALCVAPYSAGCGNNGHCKP